MASKYLSKRKTLYYMRLLSHNVGKNLYDFYKQPSTAKIRAYEHCLDEMFDNPMFDVKTTYYGVISANSCKFTFAYCIEFSHVSHLFVITADNEYYGVIVDL